MLVSGISVQVESQHILEAKRVPEPPLTTACQELTKALPCWSIEMPMNSCLNS